MCNKLYNKHKQYIFYIFLPIDIRFILQNKMEESKTHNYGAQFLKDWEQLCQFEQVLIKHNFYEFTRWQTL